MNGYLARVRMCCGTTSVDFGSYSSIDMVWENRAAAKKRQQSGSFIRRSHHSNAAVRPSPPGSLLSRGEGCYKPVHELSPLVESRCRDTLILAVRANIVEIVRDAGDPVRWDSRPPQMRAITCALRSDRNHRNARPHRGRYSLA